MMAKTSLSWSALFTAFKTSITRFPLAFIASITATCLALALSHSWHIITEPELTNYMLTAGLLLLSFASTKLYQEQQTSKLKYIPVILISAIILWYSQFILDTSLFASIVLPYLFLVSILSFAAFTEPTKNNLSYWDFNLTTLFAVAFSFLITVIIGLGVVASLASIGYLFSLKINGEIYADTWIICFWFIFPNLALAQLPKTGEINQAIEQLEVPRILAVTINYVLLPLLSLYLVILYAYLVKIIINWQLPKGNLAWMIAVFGTLGIITKLLSYPMPTAQSKLLSLFNRYFYPLMLLPCVLLFIAIYTRITEYGITEARYLVVMLAIWFSLVSILGMIKQQALVLKHVIMLFSVLAFIASFGSFSAVSIATSSQLERFKQTLVTNKLWQNNQIIAASDPLPLKVRRDITSSLNFLSSNKTRFEQIKPWFNTLISQSNDKELTNFNHKYFYGNARKLLKLMQVPYTNAWQVEQQQQAFNYNQPLFISNLLWLDNYRLALDINLYKNDKKTIVEQPINFTLNDKKIAFLARFDGTTLTLYKEKQLLASLDILAKVTEQIKTQQFEINPTNAQAFTELITTDAGTTKLIFTSINGYQTQSDNPKIQINRLNLVALVNL